MSESGRLVSPVLFQTPAGSRLYGLDHAGSDQDVYRVISKVKQNKARYAKQTIQGDQDLVVVDFGTWVEMCKSGVPQAIEACFSQMATIDLIKDYRQSFICTTGTWTRYLRTIKSFSAGDYKKRRHALRLALNLRDLMYTGRFNPTLDYAQIEYINAAAAYEVYDLALDIVWR